MRDLYTSLPPLSHLRTLHLQYRDWDPRYKDHIRVSFGSLPELQTLSISGVDAAIDMIPVLGDMAAGSGQPSVDSAVSMVFPSLRTLWLRYWVEKWRTRSERQPSGGLEWVAHNLLEPLVHALTARKRCGHEIENLVLITCRVSTNGLARMREIVGNVEAHNFVKASI
ncbi:hypothetical protein PM082_006934 [Marasmius tenuissimus]|nr:hypothetical protein PM082_006934 [Marasmius tenuissimus]